MHKSLLCAAVAAGFSGIGSGAQAAMQKFDRPSIDSPVQSVVCVGNRRNYRNFNHCWAVNGTRGSWNARYCSRICPTAGNR